MLMRYIHARGAQGALPSCSLCTNELSINENGKHLFCEHKRFSWINYCTTATKWKQKVQHRSCVAHFPLTNCYQSLANGTAQHGAGDGIRARRSLKLHVNCNTHGYILCDARIVLLKHVESSKEHLVTETETVDWSVMTVFPCFTSVWWKKKNREEPCLILRFLGEIYSLTASYRKKEGRWNHLCNMWCCRTV